MSKMGPCFKILGATVLDACSGPLGLTSSDPQQRQCSRVVTEQCWGHELWHRVGLGSNPYFASH